MATRLSSRRTEEQLESIVYETGHWVVNGSGGEVLCFAPSLHRAIQRAEEFAARGKHTMTEKR